MTTRTERIQKVNQLIEHIKIAMLVTENTDGELHSRPMTTQEQEFDGDLWFFAPRDAEAAQDIAHNPSVNVSYVGDGKFISIAGDASVVTDVAKKKELWFEAMRVWFDAGPESPEVILIKVKSHSAQYWDTPASLIGKAVSMVKVLLTGDTEAAGESATVKL